MSVLCEAAGLLGRGWLLYTVIEACFASVSRWRWCSTGQDLRASVRGGTLPLPCFSLKGGLQLPGPGTEPVCPQRPLAVPGLSVAPKGRCPFGRMLSVFVIGNVFVLSINISFFYSRQFPEYAACRPLQLTHRKGFVYSSSS